MNLHFTQAEFAGRIAVARQRMSEQALDGLLLFKQESMYYLSGYDTDGFVLFQALFLGFDGGLILVTRSADRVQAAYTSIIDDVRIWMDSQDQNPGNDVRDMLQSQGMRGKRIGVEYDAYGLSARRGQMLEAALNGFCETVDASDLVRQQRLVKSPAELDYLRRSGAICQAVQEEAVALSVPGAFEGDIRSAMHRVVWSRDGDTPAHVWPMGSGPSAWCVTNLVGGISVRTTRCFTSLLQLTGTTTQHSPLPWSLAKRAKYTMPCSMSVMRHCRPARKRCVQAGPWAMFLKAIEGLLLPEVLVTVTLTFVAIRWAPCFRPPGWKIH